MTRIFNWLTNISKSYFVVVFLLFLLLAVNRSLFHAGFFYLHDFTHSTRIAEMGRALADGQLPVRWSANFGYGFGMPLFNFYAPLPYFLGALFWLAGADLILTLKILYFILSALTLLGAYLLGKKLAGRSAGLLLATIFLLSPYRAVNLFVRGALSETFAMTFFPWVIWAGAAWLQERQKKHFLILVLSLAGIMLSHNLSALIFYPFSALFLLVYALCLKQFRLLDTLKVLLPLVGAYLLSLALTAFYSLPALLENQATIINSIFGGYFHYSNHFLYIRQLLNVNWGYGGSAWGPDDGMSFFIGFAQVVVLVVAGILLLKNFFLNLKSKISSSKKIALYLTIFSLFLIAASAFLTLLKSQWLWDNFSVLPYIQFPWRFLSLVSFCLAILAALLPTLISRPWLAKVLLTLLLLLSLLNLRFFRPDSYLDNSNALYYGDSERIVKEMSSILPDYIPAQMAEQGVLQKLVDLPATWTDASDNSLSVDTVYHKSQEQLYLVQTPVETMLNFKTAAFPGWQGQLDGQTVKLQSNPELGNLQMTIPTGQHLVGLHFTENTPARLIGDVLSLLALLSLLLYLQPFSWPPNSKRGQR